MIAKSCLLAFGTGRIILRQGHPVDPGSGLYYVVTGTLTVEIETVNQITLQVSSEVVKKLNPGDSFGEAAILFNDLRESTVTVLSKYL